MKQYNNILVVTRQNFFNMLAPCTILMNKPEHLEWANNKHNDYFDGKGIKFELTIELYQMSALTLQMRVSFSLLKRARDLNQTLFCEHLLELIFPCLICSQKSG